MSYPPEALLFECEVFGLVEAMGPRNRREILCREIHRYDIFSLVDWRLSPSELTPLTPAAEEFLAAVREGLE